MLQRSRVILPSLITVVTASHSTRPHNRPHPPSALPAPVHLSIHPSAGLTHFLGLRMFSNSNAYVPGKVPQSLQSAPCTAPASTHPSAGPRWPAPCRPAPPGRSGQPSPPAGGTSQCTFSEEHRQPCTASLSVLTARPGLHVVPWRHGRDPGPPTRLPGFGSCTVVSHVLYIHCKPGNLTTCGCMPSTSARVLRRIKANNLNYKKYEFKAVSLPTCGCMPSTSARVLRRVISAWRACALVFLRMVPPTGSSTTSPLMLHGKQHAHVEVMK